MEKDGQVTGEATRSMAVLSSQREGGPHEEAHRRQLAESFQRGWDAFQEAAPRHAAVMAWIVEDGLSNDEISELLGRTPGATREFVSQCRKRARVHLAEWYQLALGAGEVR